MNYIQDEVKHWPMIDVAEAVPSQVQSVSPPMRLEGIPLTRNVRTQLFRARRFEHHSMYE